MFPPLCIKVRYPNIQSFGYFHRRKLSWLAKSNYPCAHHWRIRTESIPVAETLYDLAIIGGGPAGYTCAIRAGQLGLKVALIEKTDKLGGTCLHVGCIPTKAMLFSAEVWDHLKHAEGYGIDGVCAPKLNWANVLKRKNDIIVKHTKGLDFLMKKNKITVVRGHGRLTGGAVNGVFTIDVTTEDKGKGQGAEQQTATKVQAKK